jgi:hypothetical protein
MIIALAEVARSSRIAVPPLERMEAQSLDHAKEKEITQWRIPLDRS